MAGMPPKKESEKVKTYRVSPGRRIGDNDGNICEAGEDIKLTAKQAKFMQGIGAIFVPIEEDDDDEEPKAEPTPTRRAAQTKISQA